MPSQLKYIKFISQTKGLADQSKIAPFDEYIFIAFCELSRENKNVKNKTGSKKIHEITKKNRQDGILGESWGFY